ncbi:MAG: enoyl-CoA hydratase/isomerase family protein, partial [Candidatus Binatia bacterium]
MPTQYGDVAVTLAEHIATVEIRRGPNNFFDIALIQSLADAFEALDNEAACRAIVLAAEGKHFCAGANFHNPDAQSGLDRSVERGNPLYAEAVRLFACRKPTVGAIQGAAIGGGFGLALVPDFRVLCSETRFSANFVKLGFHPGFGLTYT